MHEVCYYQIKLSTLPLFELRVDDPVGETLSTNTDTFKYTITLELVQYQWSVNITCNKHNTRSVTCR